MEKAVVIVVLLMIIGFQFFLVLQYRSVNEEQMGEIERITAINKNLSISIDNLQKGLEVSGQQISQLEAANKDLYTSYTELKSEIDSTVMDLNAYEKEINESIGWFKANSDLVAVSEGQGIGEYITNYCYHTDVTRDKHYVKTGCLILVNENKLGLKYKEDIVTSEKVDKLQSLSEFIKNKGGDCEDFSLFYKAEWNYLIANIQSPSTVIVDAWEPVETSEIYWLDFLDTWFYKNANPVELKGGYIYPNVVCGDLYDLNTGEINGHCMIALTKSKIGSVAELNKLKDAPIIEPQNGRYYGRINNPDSGVYIAQNINDIGTTGSVIYKVVTDEDMHLFVQSIGSWKSYKLFYDEFEEAVKKIELLK